jgi:hypothetical protein
MGAKMGRIVNGRADGYRHRVGQARTVNSAAGFSARISIQSGERRETGAYHVRSSAIFVKKGVDAPSAPEYGPRAFDRL